VQLFRLSTYEFNQTQSEELEGGHQERRPGAKLQVCEL